MKQICHFVISCMFFMVLFCNHGYGQYDGMVYLKPNTHICSFDTLVRAKYSKDITFIKETNNTKGLNENGWSHDTYSLLYKGIPLEYAELKVHSKDGQIILVNGFIYDSINIENVPQISEYEALQCALKYIGAEKYSWTDSKYTSQGSKNQKLDNMFSQPPVGKLVICPIYKSANKKTACLTYKFDIMSTYPFNYISIYIDSQTGRVVHVNSHIQASHTGYAQTRYSGNQYITTEYINNCYVLNDNDRGGGIYTYDNQNSTPENYIYASQIQDEDNNWTSSEYHNYKKDAALDAHWGAEVTFDYFYYTFGRNGIDDAGMAINNYVHTKVLLGYTADWIPVYDKCNAWWISGLGNNGIMAYGDGNDSSVPDAFVTLDIVAHELGHGITNNTAKLNYSWESGAINESISDIWAACVENYANVGKNIWLIGDEIFHGDTAARSMCNPKAYHQPDTYQSTGQNGYWKNYPAGTIPNNSNDQCGVHTNSGVLNYWFYLLSEGGTGTNDFNYHYDVEGIGIETAAQIVYHALCNYFTSTTDYTDAALLTRATAIELYGYCSQELKSVIDAWKAVGVPVDDIPETLNITETLQNGIHKHYYAISSLTTSSTLDCGASALYESSGKITFAPGFRAKQGSSVVARIVPCSISNNTNGFPSQSRINSKKTPPSISKDHSLDISVSPNPALDNIVVSGVNKESSYVIYDTMGKIVKIGIIKHPYQIGVAQLLQGTYILRVTTGDYHSYVKFIKQ